MADLVPKSFSWKTIQDCSIPIRDQDMVPCSWAFAAATLVSYQLRICDKQVWDFEPSVQYLIEHCNGESSCNGEFSSQLYQQILPKTRQGTLAVLQYIEKHGVPLETRIPCDYYSRQVVSKSEPKGPIIRIRGIVTLPENTPLDHIKKILVDHPIIASVEVYDSLLPYKFPKGEEDVYATDIGLKVGGSHYLVIIGYGNQNGREFYEVHNSWGRGWGNKGYGRILCQLVRPFAYVDKASIDTSSSSMACRKLTTDDLQVVQAEEYEDDGVSPMVIYDGNSTTDDPDRFFTDLALLAMNYFMKRNCLHRGKLVKLDKVTSVVINGVLLTLTLTADLRGNRDPEFDTDDQTLEAEIWYRGSLLETEAFHILSVVIKICCSDYIPKEVTDKVLAKYKFNDSDSDSDWDEGEEPEDSLTSEQFVTELAEVAITTFNAHYPHMPYQFLGLVEFKASRGYFINYSITMTAKPKPPHDAKTDAPPVQTFLAIMSYQGGLPTEATVQGMIIVDPLQAS